MPSASHVLPWPAGAGRGEPRLQHELPGRKLQAHELRHSQGANFPRPHELLRLQDRAARARGVEVLVDRIFEHIIPIGLFRCGGALG
jgi:hypothetical protein